MLLSKGGAAQHRIGAQVGIEQSVIMVLHRTAGQRHETERGVGIDDQSPTEEAVRLCP